MRIYLFMLILIYLSLFTDFCRIFAPYLERDLFSYKLRLINTYTNVSHLKSV